MSHKTPVTTENGTVYVITNKPQDANHLQEKIDNAAQIEIDGLGKVVKYEHAMAVRAENSYKKITSKPTVIKKMSLWKRFWLWLVSWFDLAS
jgi:hypothetical protein